MMVASGYKTTSTGAKVYVYDPSPVDTPAGPPNTGGSTYWISYDVYLQGADHWHWRDYYAK